MTHHYCSKSVVYIRIGFDIVHSIDLDTCIHVCRKKDILKFSDTISYAMSS
jgi:hypothetical protein